MRGWVFGAALLMAVSGTAAAYDGQVVNREAKGDKLPVLAGQRGGKLDAVDGYQVRDFLRRVRLLLEAPVVARE